MASYRDYESAQTRSPGAQSNTTSPFADPTNEYRDSPPLPPKDQRPMSGVKREGAATAGGRRTKPNIDRLL